MGTTIIVSKEETVNLKYCAHSTHHDEQRKRDNQEKQKFLIDLIQAREVPDDAKHSSPRQVPLQLR